MNLIRSNLGKLLVLCNVIVLGAMIGTVVAPGFSLNIAEMDLMLKVVQAGWLVAAIAIFYMVLQTYRAFPEKDIKVGVAGFFMIMLAYAVTAGILLTGFATTELELAANLIVAVGYGTVAIAAGWIR